MGIPFDFNADATPAASRVLDADLVVATLAGCDRRTRRAGSSPPVPRLARARWKPSKPLLPPGSLLGTGDNLKRTHRTRDERALLGNSSAVASCMRARKCRSVSFSVFNVHAF